MEGKKWEGRLEICSDERWNRIHSEGWTQKNTKVVCTFSGYEIETGDTMTHMIYFCTIKKKTFTGDSEVANLSLPQAQSKPMYSHTFDCSGTELSLLQCAFVPLAAVSDIVSTEISCKICK